MSIDVLEVLLRTDISELAIAVEDSMRGIVARINEQGDEIVHVLVIAASESDEPIEDDGSAFGIPDPDSPMAAHFESEVWLRAKD